MSHWLYRSRSCAKWPKLHSDAGNGESRKTLGVRVLPWAIFLVACCIFAIFCFLFAFCLFSHYKYQYFSSPSSRPSWRAPWAPVPPPPPPWNPAACARYSYMCQSGSSARARPRRRSGSPGWLVSDPARAAPEPHPAGSAPNPSCPRLLPPQRRRQRRARAGSVRSTTPQLATAPAKGESRNRQERRLRSAGVSARLSGKRERRGRRSQPPRRRGGSRRDRTRSTIDDGGGDVAQRRASRRGARQRRHHQRGRGGGCRPDRSGNDAGISAGR